MKLIGALIVAAFLLGALVASSLVNRPKESDNDSDNKNNVTPEINKITAWRNTVHAYISQRKRERHEERHYRNPNIRWTRRTYWVVFAYTAVTLVLLFVNYTQLQETKVSGRAWVGPVSAGATGTLTVNEPLTVSIKYHNTGREPARDTFYDMVPFITSIEQDQNGETARTVSDYINRCRSTLPIDGASVVYPTAGFSSYTAGNVIPGNEITYDVIYGTAYIVVVGCFVYRTINEIHRSGYCFFYQNGSKGTTVGEWPFCHTGNYAD